MSDSEFIKDRLVAGIKSLELDMDVDKLFGYLSLLHKWNQAYNLTAVRDMESMVARHVLDSLAITGWIKATDVLDVGTGPGLPGIPLALARPDLNIVLLDSNGKKIRFLREVKRVLSLNNIDIVQTRVEDYHREDGFDTIVSRAFSELQTMMDWTKHLIAKQGIWVAMKGRHPDAELASIQQHYRVETYAVTGVEGERCCIIIDNKG